VLGGGGWGGGVTERRLVHEVDLGVEVGQVGVLVPDDAGDEVQQRLRAVRRLRLQQLNK